MRLSDLPDDVVFVIASLCPAQDVLNLSQTSSRLRIFLLSPLKQLWLRLFEELNDFSESCQSDRPNTSSPSELSCDELRNLVLKAHRGRWNWLQNNGPSATQTQIIPLQNRGGFFGSICGTRGDWSRPHPRNGIKFTKGCDGRFVTVIWTSGYLQIFDAHQGKCVWTYPRLGDFASDLVVACDSETLCSDDGRPEALNITFITRPEDGKSLILMQCILDLLSLRAHESRHITLPCVSDHVIDMGCCKFAFWIEENIDGQKNVRFIDQSLSVFPLRIGIHQSNPAIFINDCYVTVKTINSSLVIDVLDVRNTYHHLSEDDSLQVHSDPAKRSPVTVSRSELNACSARLILLMPNDLRAHDIALFSPRTTDNAGSVTRVYAVASATSKDRPDHSIFVVYEIYIVVDRAHTLVMQQSASAPIITGTQRTCCLIRPFAHKHLVESVMALGRGGRGLLASKNKTNKKMRCYAISVEHMLQANEKHRNECRDARACMDECFSDLGSLAPVHFGNDSIAPGAVYLEARTGVVTFTRDDPKTGYTNELLIQSYD